MLLGSISAGTFWLYPGRSAICHTRDPGALPAAGAGMSLENACHFTVPPASGMISNEANFTGKGFLGLQRKSKAMVCNLISTSQAKIHPGCKYRAASKYTDFS